MIKISVLYPNHEGAHFDMHYYVGKHMPWAIELLSAHLRYFFAYTIPIRLTIDPLPPHQIM